MARFNARWRRITMAALAVTLGVTFAGWRAGAASAEPAPQLTAVEIADGVLFNDGPAAKYLTELDRPETPWTDEMRRIQELIRRYLDADPQLAKALSTWMQSGDPLKVAKGMHELGAVARKVLDELYGSEAIDKWVGEIDKAWGEERLYLQYTQVQLTQLINETMLDMYKGADTAVAVDVAVVAVAVVAVVVAVVAIDATPREFSQRTRLAHEMLVKTIATSLRAKY
ncbi:hypothetical protein ABNF97_23265 [Plantactinospora sp. B6F1]|uniref:hypothetical protein n=1 Tax=Plantactinospora sp. B6F1 TaxID=3158971 RepID=UPI0032D910C4